VIFIDVIGSDVRSISLKLEEQNVTEILSHNTSHCRCLLVYTWAILILKRNNHCWIETKTWATTSYYTFSTAFGHHHRGVIRRRMEILKIH